MKVLLLLIVVLFSFLGGYLAEPKMRMQLTGKPENFVKSRPGPIEVEDPSTGANDPIKPTAPSGNPSDTPDGFGNDANKPPVNPTVPEVVVNDPPSNPTVPEFIEPPSNPQPENPVVQPETPTQMVDVVAAMKASLASRQISKFTADKVLEWQPGSGTESIDGETYQTGTVVYQTETPFGTKNLPAKALIKDGKVVRWISPKSGMQIE